MTPISELESHSDATQSQAGHIGVTDREQRCGTIDEMKPQIGTFHLGLPTSIIYNIDILTLQDYVQY